MYQAYDFRLFSGLIFLLMELMSFMAAPPFYGELTEPCLLLWRARTAISPLRKPDFRLSSPKKVKPSVKDTSM
jgi:hypothetical protein